jgi:hypothetical protein
MIKIPVYILRRKDNKKFYIKSAGKYFLEDFIFFKKDILNRNLEKLFRSNDNFDTEDYILEESLF